MFLHIYLILFSFHKHICEDYVRKLFC